MHGDGDGDGHGDRASAISTRRVARIVKGAARNVVDDALVVEAPLELRIAGTPSVVLMRTPGHDEHLACGLLFAEGVIARAAELANMHRPETATPEERGNVLELGLDPKTSKMPDRTLYSSSSCGVCGKTAIAALELRTAPLHDGLEISAAFAASLPDRLRAAQPVFDATGALHAAGAFDANGVLIAAFEDVGRHNAVDKLVGWALARNALPMSAAVLCVSGRVSFEIVQKAIVAGFPIIVAVSAPSSLAVDMAERFRVTLCGFVRGGGLNIYSHAARVRP